MGRTRRCRVAHKAVDNGSITECPANRIGWQCATGCIIEFNPQRVGRGGCPVEIRLQAAGRSDHYGFCQGLCAPGNTIGCIQYNGMHNRVGAGIGIAVCGRYGVVHRRSVAKIPEPGFHGTYIGNIRIYLKYDGCSFARRIPAEIYSPVVNKPEG